MIKPYICLLCVLSSCAGADPFTDLVQDAGDDSCSDEQSETDSAQNLDTDTDTDTDTWSDDTDTDNIESCPWICRPKRLNDQAACDPWWESVDIEPDWVHNWRFDDFCPGGELCCQPTHSTDKGAFTQYCKDLLYPMLTECKNPYPAYCWSVGNICCPDPE